MQSPRAVPNTVRARRARPPLPRWVIGVMVLCTVIEAAFWLAPLVGLGGLRRAADFLGGFWSPVFWAGHGIYPFQPLVMFASYGLLHSGLAHLAMNMLSLMAIARELNVLIGARRMFVVYVVSQIAAALAFALMAPDAGPMIGASGAIFGLAGALIGHAAVAGRRLNRPLGQLWRGVALIVVLNVALTVLIPSIAWEAHLGGAVTGLMMGAFTGHRATRRR